MHEKEWADLQATLKEKDRIIGEATASVMIELDAVLDTGDLDPKSRALIAASLEHLRGLARAFVPEMIENPEDLLRPDDD